MGRWKLNSIQTKILLWTGLSLLLIAAVIVTLAATSLRSQAIEDAEENAVAVAQAEAAHIQAKIEIALDAARTMAQSLEGIKSEQVDTPTRDQVNAMLKPVLEENPDFLAVYTLWEPNAFDGLDEEYVHAPAHDETGRFIPYWYRDLDGNVQVEALVNYEVEGAGDWYLLPKRTKSEQVLDPFLYPVQNQDVLMSSLVNPIVVDDQFYGIVGVDLRVDFLQSLANELDIYDGAGELVLISNNGTLAGVTGKPELVGQEATAFSDQYADVLDQIEQGETFKKQFEDQLAVFVPIVFGQTDTPWSVNILIPYNNITADANSMVTRMVVIGVILTAAALVLFWFISRQIANPLIAMTETATDIAQGNLDARVDVKSSDEIGVLAKTFNTMTAQLQGTLAGLEETVASRTRDLELAAEVGQSLALVRDPEVMLAEAVEMIRERFDLYYTQIYLTDPSGRTLTLRAGTGEVGQTLLQRGQHLPVDLSSINGIAAVEHQAVVVEDTEASTLHRPNPLLPETRSEMAVPLISGERVLGVLDMQSSEPGALREENLTAFETLASQLAITLVNTELFTDLENARREVEIQARRTTREGWETFLDAIERPERIGYRFEEGDLELLDRPLTGALDDSQAMVVPIRVAGETLGSFQLEGGQNWSPEDIDMVENVAQQVAQQIENLRLLAQSQRYQQEAQEAVRRLTREGWQKAEQLLTHIGYVYRDERVKPLSSSDGDDEGTWVQEILVSDEPIGEIGIKQVEQLSPEDAQIIATIGEQLAAHIENLRLTEQTQNQAQREQALRQITAAVRGSTDPENIMRTAVRELGRVLGRRAVVRLQRSGDDGQDA